MKQPFNTQSWNRFKELMRGLIKRVTALSLKSDAFDDRITKAEKELDKIENINDITTGINLFRGTRDFSIGSKLFGKTWFIDGFKEITANYHFETGEDGFVIASGTTNENAAFYQIANEKLISGEIYTLFFEYRITKQGFPGGETIAYLTLEDSNSATYYAQRITDYEIEVGTWHKAIMFYTIPDIDVSDKMLRGGPNSPKIGIEFRKVGLYKGRIEHPEWAASPFDIDRINDITTGINLLRGTRDFSQGSIPWFKNSRYFTDGFNATLKETYNVLEKDSDGFSEIHVEESQDISSIKATFASTIVGLEEGEEITVSFDFMIDDLEDYTSTAIFRYDVFSPSGDEGTSLGGEQWSVQDGINEPLESGKWYRWVKTITPKWVSPENMFLPSIRINRAGSLHYKKLKIERGRIKHPVWSASPFDVAQQVDLTTAKIYDVSKLMTASEGFDNPNFATLRVSGDKVAQLYIEVKSLKEIAQGETFYPVTLDSSIRPIIHVFAGSRVTLGSISSTDGKASFLSMSKISSGSTIQIMSTYVLNNSFNPTATLELPGGEIPVPLLDSPTNHTDGMINGEYDQPSIGLL